MRALAILLCCGLTACTSTARAHPGSKSSDPGPAGDPGLVVVNGPDVENAALTLIASASHSIDLEIYELGDPAIIHALIARQVAGVPVRVILDSTEQDSLAAAPQLRSGGISVEMASGPGIDHVKLLVVDNSTVLTGGVNFGATSEDTSDMDVQGEIPGAEQFFAADWAAAPAAPAAPATPSAPVIANATAPTAAASQLYSGSAVLTQIEAVIAAARTKIFVGANYLTSYPVQNALIAAAARGVAVIVFLNPSATGAAAAQEWMVGHGVTVLMAPETPYLHAKVVLTDNEGIIGSANFSDDSMQAHNHELDVTITGSTLAQAWAWTDSLPGMTGPPGTSGLSE